MRFEVTFGVLAPDLEVLAPIRDANIPRDKALALRRGVGDPAGEHRAPYSVDENLWGRTAECGPLEDPWVAPPEDAFARTGAPRGPAGGARRDRRRVRARACPVALDGEPRPCRASSARSTRSAARTGSAAST